MRLPFGTFVIVLMAMASAAHADTFAFNTYPAGDPNLTLITPKGVVYSGNQSGISFAGNGFVDVDVVLPNAITLDKLFFQMSDMNTPGVFSGELFVNGSPVAGAGPEISIIDPVAPNPTLTDLEWDLAVNLALSAGDVLKIRFDHVANMSTSGSTAARLHIVAGDGAPDAIGTDVFNGNFITPLSLLAEAVAVPEPSTYVLGLLGFLGLSFTAWQRKYRRT